MIPRADKLFAHHFKTINDRNGHAVGDTILQLFARVVRQTMRASDVIGRLGGEEFVALLPGTLSDATRAAERVRSAFAAAYVVRNGQHIATTVSIGVASGTPSTTIDRLIADADTALYRAKTNGRNRVETSPVGAEAASRRKNERENAAVYDDALENCLA